MASTLHGQYPIERRAGEIERLHVQGDALAPDAAIMLDEIGVGGGWHCLDLGCGPGGIMELMLARVGASGRVVGLDADEFFLAHARERFAGAANFELVRDDAYRTSLPGDSFDLVHTRFLASTAGEADKLLAEAIRLAKPGGVVAFQEPDIDGLNCYPPHPAWQQLRQLLAQVFPSVGGDKRLARELFRLLRAAGLEDVRFRPFLVGYRSDHAMVDYVPATVESIRTRVLEKNLTTAEALAATLAECRAHLALPDTVTTYHTMMQVWGRKPR